jgi:hypothetical protein
LPELDLNIDDRMLITMFGHTQTIRPNPLDDDNYDDLPALISVSDSGDES